MDVRKLESQLKSEGFSHTFVWQDGPNAHYPDHTHNGLTAHIILDGEMTLTVHGKSQTYRVGERCDVGAGDVHSAKMGPNGCRYLIGEKQAAALSTGGRTHRVKTRRRARRQSAPESTRS